MMLIASSRSLATGQCRRAFSNSASRAVSLQWDKNNPQALAEVFPPYPYGEPQWYKQQRLGLYGGSKIEFGNNKAERFTKKTRRVWRPNILTRKLYSQSLNRTVQVRVSTRVLRTIDKLGGLDEYLLGEKETRIKELGPSGWWLRWAIMQTATIKKRFADERKALGLPNPIEETVAEAEEDAAVSLEGADVETLSTDDAFVVEQSAKLPPIKFRVGPGQHIFLTEDGWKRVRPSGVYRERLMKEAIASTRFPEYVEKRVAAYEKEIATQLEVYDFGSANSRKVSGSESEQRELRTAMAAKMPSALQKARQEFQQELNGIVDQVYKHEIDQKNKRVRMNILVKRKRVKVRRRREAELSLQASSPESWKKAAGAQNAPEESSKPVTSDVNAP